MRNERGKGQGGRWRIGTGTGGSEGGARRKDPQKVQKETSPPNKRGRDRSDPCMAHEKVPGWMGIQWARATRLLAARWGRNTG